MRMHFLDGGLLRMKARIFLPDADRASEIEMPVISTLFRHAGGNVLFDTGCHPSAETDPEARWGGLARLMAPIPSPHGGLLASLARVGLRPEDIDVVINSHLHPDHCGCNAFFTRATFHCHARELAAAGTEDAAAQGYLRAEWDHPMDLRVLENSLDVFGDARLVTLALPGHTPGLIGLRADLAKSGTFLIASDAVSLRRNLDQDEVPRNAWNAEALLRSYEEIRAHEARGATVICGHDDGQWQHLRTGLQAYD